MTTHWLLRVGDGKEFKSAAKHNLWGMESHKLVNANFLKQVQPGDLLWFVRNKSNGKLLGVATYVGHGKRVLGPIVDLSKTNEELGWVGDMKTDIEIHYKGLYDLEFCEMLTGIKGQTNVRRYSEKCLLNLPEEYERIVNYSRAKKL